MSTLSWGSRPRLYAVACSAGFSINLGFAQILSAKQEAVGLLQQRVLPKQIEEH
jgi:hypothetical protein